MRRLPKPTFTASDALNLCIASIQDTDLKHRLGLAAPTIDAAEQAYVVNGAQATLYTVQSTNGVAGYVTTKEMGRVYKGTFVSSVKTRHIYDTIKKLPENDICPLCGQRTVFTLDHHLAQSLHPALVVTAVNLVPSCDECNIIKRTFQPMQASDQTLHPYFDDVDDDQWLFARVEKSSPAAFVFSATPPVHWPNVKRSRVVTHFRKLELGALYASHSAVELNNIRYDLQFMAARTSPEEIRDHLREQANSRAAFQINSWQRATYDAMADSEWFYSGGFN